MIDDSDSMSWQMPLDQIDTMWVESIRLFLWTERRKGEDVFGEEWRKVKNKETNRQRQNRLSRNTWAGTHIAEPAAGHILSLRVKNT